MGSLPSGADDLVPVPTIRELAERRDGSAEVTHWVNEGTQKNPRMVPSRFRLLDKGNAILRDAMRHNAQVRLARGDGDWVQPPSSGKERNNAS